MSHCRSRCSLSAGGGGGRRWCGWNALFGRFRFRRLHGFEFFLRYRSHFLDKTLIVVQTFPTGPQILLVMAQAVVDHFGEFLRHLDSGREIAGSIVLALVGRRRLGQYDQIVDVFVGELFVFGIAGV